MAIEFLPVEPTSRGPSLVCAVVHPSPVGAHVALWYRADSAGHTRLLHQAWHYDTRHETPSEFLRSAENPVLGVVPTLDELELFHLRAACARVASHLARGTLPYALHPRDATILEDGRVALGASLGLTCATFLLKVFESASIDLLDFSTWEQVTDPVRLAEDQAAQRKIVRGLRQEAQRERDPQKRDALHRHADAVERDIGGTPRVRAEEVAAATRAGSCPGTYALIEPQGAVVLRALRPTSER